MKLKGHNNRWTFDDFKDRVKYKIGDTAYTIEVVNSSNGIYPHHSIYIKENIVSGLTSSTLNASNIATAHLTYFSGKDALHGDMFWDNDSYATKEEAIEALEQRIKDEKEYYDKQYEEYGKHVKTSYARWLYYLQEQKKLIEGDTNEKD